MNWKLNSFTFAKLVVSSSLLSATFIFYLDYQFVQKVQLDKIRAEIKKIEPETISAEYEAHIKKIEAAHAEQINDLNMQQIENSNKLSKIEIEIKEHDKNLAEMTAKYKILNAKSETLHGETVAAEKATELFSSLAPNVSLHNQNFSINNIGESIGLSLHTDLKNEGKFMVNIKSRIRIINAETNKNILCFQCTIEGIKSDNCISSGSILNMNQVMNTNYVAKLTNEFSKELTDTKTKFTFWVQNEYETDNASVEFITKKISSFFNKNNILDKKKSFANSRTSFYCWNNSNGSFSCSKNLN